MKSDIFKYDLPKKRIAQYPLKERGTSNLLVLDRENGNIEHKKYYNIPEYIKKGDVVVLNETKVQKRRTYFLTPNRREVEVLFLNEEESKWFCLIGGGRYVKDDDILASKEDSNIRIKVVSKKENGYLIKILGNTKASKIFNLIGHTPLPPYMKRKDEKEDEVRYNTVFCRIPGSVAATTASLNLTEKILEEIEAKGAKIVRIELRVGWGTFAPIREENIEEHKIHREYIHVSEEVVNTINSVKARGNSIWAFGTTVTRTLESIVSEGKVRPYSGYTQLFIYPRFEFKIVDHLVTNFHQPDSSLILLVSAFAGIDEIKKVYNIALENKYRFLSYGDSMLIL